MLARQTYCVRGHEAQRTQKCGAAWPTLGSQKARTIRSTRHAGFQNTAGLSCWIVLVLLDCSASKLNKWATPDHGGDRRATL